MSKNKKLFEEAIAEARTIKEAAIANAKLVLEENLTPQLQQMFAAKLQEMEDEEADETELNENDGEEDLNLDEILAELDSYEDLDEAKDEDKDDKEEKPSKKEDKKDDKKDDKSKSSSEKEPTESKEDLVKDLTVDELRGLISSIIADELGATQDNEMGDMDNMGDEMSDLGNTDFDGDNMDMNMDMGDEMGNGDEDIDLDELLAELEALDESPESEDLDEAKDEELEEAKKAINTLRSELKEVNLLNAKLLYVNKIFKSRNLNENQKVKVLETLDKAESTKEAKLIYESLLLGLSNEKLASKNQKQNIKESLGFASKPAGKGRQQAQIVEDNVVARFKKLANIK